MSQTQSNAKSAAVGGERERDAPEAGNCRWLMHMTAKCHLYQLMINYSRYWWVPQSVAADGTQKSNLLQWEYPHRHHQGSPLPPPQGESLRNASYHKLFKRQHISNELHPPHTQSPYQSGEEYGQPNSMPEASNSGRAWTGGVEGWRWGMEGCEGDGWV